jgi:hypothetical protein
MPPKRVVDARIVILKQISETPGIRYRELIIVFSDDDYLTTEVIYFAR